VVNVISYTHARPEDLAQAACGARQDPNCRVMSSSGTWATEGFR
jgi:hypothetical protein